MNWFKAILLWILVKLGLVKIKREPNWYPTIKRASRNGVRWSKSRSGRNVDIRVRLNAMEKPQRHRTAWESLGNNAPNGPDQGPG